MLSKNELLELYKIAIEEYRFEVDLNWQRVKYYCVLNIGIITIATGLLKVNQKENDVSFLVSMIFFIGVVTSFLGIYSIKKGNIYYHRTLYKKALIERELGLFNFISKHDELPIDISVSTTPGMDKEIKTIDMLKYSEKKKSPRSGTIKYNMILVLYLLSLLNCVGFVYCIINPVLIFLKHLCCK